MFPNVKNRIQYNSAIPLLGIYPIEVNFKFTFIGSVATESKSRSYPRDY